MTEAISVSYSWVVFSQTLTVNDGCNDPKHDDEGDSRVHLGPPLKKEL